MNNTPNDCIYQTNPIIPKISVVSTMTVGEGISTYQKRDVSVACLPLWRQGVPATYSLDVVRTVNNQCSQS